MSTDNHIDKTVEQFTAYLPATEGGFIETSTGDDAAPRRA